MLRRFLAWLLGPDPTLPLLQSIITNQQLQQERTAELMKDMVTANQSLMSEYLSLFKPIAGDAPTTWRADPVQDNTNELLEAGFPLGADDSEKAQWILDHLGEI